MVADWDTPDWLREIPSPIELQTLVFSEIQSLTTSFSSRMSDVVINICYDGLWAEERLEWVAVKSITFLTSAFLNTKQTPLLVSHDSRPQQASSFLVFSLVT